MMKIKLKSRNFEKLQRFSAFSRKSEQISLKSAKIATIFEKMQNILAFMLLKMLRNWQKLLKYWGLSGAKICKFCRSRQQLSNEYLLSKIGVDTAENEPLKVWGESLIYSLLFIRVLTRTWRPRRRAATTRPSRPSTSAPPPTTPRTRRSSPLQTASSTRSPRSHTKKHRLFKRQLVRFTSSMSTNIRTWILEREEKKEEGEKG